MVNKASESVVSTAVRMLFSLGLNFRSVLPFEKKSQFASAFDYELFAVTMT